MYGMVNKFIGRTISSHYGEEKWQQICQRVPHDLNHIEAVANYPDKLTFDIVTQACDVLDEQADVLLRLLGCQWVRYTAQEDYAELFAVTGSDFYTFMRQLNGMHASLQLQMTSLKPPFFHVEKLNETSILIEYYSERKGLTAFAQGLLEGLCDYFNYDAVVSLLEERGAPDFVAAFIVDERLS